MLLTQRSDIAPARIAEIADQLEVIRVSVLDTVQAAAATEQSNDVRSRVETYLRSTGKDELNPDGIQRDFSLLLERSRRWF